MCRSRLHLPLNAAWVLIWKGWGRFKFGKSSKAYGDRSSKESDSSQPKANVSSTVNDPVLEENITKAAEQIPAHEVPVEVEVSTGLDLVGTSHSVVVD
ncbi:hypothetical protein ACOSQ3_002136 [Xanthoceras sorbifolium]